MERGIREREKFSCWKERKNDGVMDDKSGDGGA